MRLKNSGGHGGQNGIRNIILHLGTQDFARVRFGISRPPGKMNPADYVLQKFAGDDVIEAGICEVRTLDGELIEDGMVSTDKLRPARRSGRSVLFVERGEESWLPLKID